MARNMRLQSAMEYLMTYGWAILIIAVVMVALFSLGILGGNPLGTSCLSQSGYICQSPVLHATTFNVVVGQATGNNWVGTNVFWVNQGTSSTTIASALCNAAASANTFSTNGGAICASANTIALNSGGTATLVFVSTATATVGATSAGTLWATYYLTAGGTQYTVQLATATLKAV